MKQRIHIFGASGSGTTTIAKKLCEGLGYTHFDTDSYYWHKTEEPFTDMRPVEERLVMMKKDLNSHENWILSGSLDGWGNPLVSMFDLVIFVYVPQDIRIKRLKVREQERYGDDVLPGGRRHESTQEFIEWASGYDSGLLTGRNLPRHEKWLAELQCSTLRIINDDLEKSIAIAMRAIKN